MPTHLLLRLADFDVLAWSRRLRVASPFLGRRLKFSRYPNALDVRSLLRQRAPSPKLQVLNTAPLTAQAPLASVEVRWTPEFWRQLVELAIGGHLANRAAGTTAEVFYWRERGREGNYVVRLGKRVVAIEVKSGASKGTLFGMEALTRICRP